MAVAKLPLIVGVVALSLVGCGYREVEPARAPAREIPVAPARSNPPRPGDVRVVLDANGEPAAVTEITATASSVSTADTPWGTARGESHALTVRPICITPCVSDFEPGLHILNFQSRRDEKHLSTTEVQIDENTKAIRHSMGRVEPDSAGYTTGVVMAVLGVATAIAGGVVWGVAAASSSEMHDERSLGKALTAVGGGTVALSIPLMILTRPSLQRGTTIDVSDPPR